MKPSPAEAAGSSSSYSSWWWPTTATGGKLQGCSSSLSQLKPAGEETAGETKLDTVDNLFSWLGYLKSVQ